MPVENAATAGHGLGGWQVGANHRSKQDHEQLLPAQRKYATDQACADAQDDKLQREQHQDLSFARAEAAHHRRRIEVAAEVARRRQRNRGRGEDHGDQRGEAEILLRALEGLPDFGTQVANRLDALAAFQPRLDPVAIRIAGRARHEQPPGRPVSRLQKFRRGDVVDVHQQPGPQREQSTGDLGVLLYDCCDGQRRFADDEPCAFARVEPRGEAGIDPDLAGRGDAICDAARGIGRVAESDRAAQGIARRRPP